METESARRAAIGRASDGASPGTPRWLRAIGLGLAISAGGLCLAFPFWGDQALFTIYGRELTRGAVLYRDIFDVKQPGIFVFYALGGSLFGFTEVGIHLFELVYWLAFSVFALKALPAYFATRWAPALVPVFTIVVYYFSAGLLDLTQVEILVAFPILVAWWLIERARPGTRTGVARYAAAGLAAAAVVLLKHLYVLIVLAFLVDAIARDRRVGAPRGDVLRRLAAFTISLLVPLLAVGVYFAAYGQLGRIWWAYFELASAAQLTGSRPFSYLVFGGRRFLIAHAPMLILAVIACAAMLRGRDRPNRDLVVGMVLWLFVGGVAFLIQGWPEYKWSLFTVPVGVLGVAGIEILLARTWPRNATRWLLGVLAGALALISFVLATRPRIQTMLLASVILGAAAGVGAVIVRPARAGRAMTWATLMMFAISVGVLAPGPVRKVRVLAEHDFATTVEAREEIRRLNQAYVAADHDLAILRREHPAPGPLYVFGDPILLLRAHRSQAAPILGWGPEFLDTRAWRELYEDLRASPPPYVVVDPYIGSFVERRYPRILTFIESRYEVAFVGQSGTWYRRA